LPKQLHHQFTTPILPSFVLTITLLDLQQITMETFELKSHTSVTSTVALNRNQSVQERDNVHLQRMGKKPVLKVCTPIMKSRSRLAQ
jgi:hypothetical protein